MKIGTKIIVMPPLPRAQNLQYQCYYPNWAVQFISTVAIVGTEGEIVIGRKNGLPL